MKRRSYVWPASQISPRGSGCRHNTCGPHPRDLAAQVSGDISSMRLRHLVIATRWKRSMGCKSGKIEIKRTSTFLSCSFVSCCIAWRAKISEQPSRVAF
ncbi:hypothetical protein K431DRAFT_168511 [Polychaeton citri CBS 116435]|uniref:Uncharacterized protein n=1 Tax=Polychaeton citri CBS 116435 TaxID=1314669 RepID=A0A9P4PZX1_9PEZI|nr:hypothetical protein K431DRAFT_168511 [Polychaeton citri CBS 116435]